MILVALTLDLTFDRSCSSTYSECMCDTLLTIDHVQSKAFSQYYLEFSFSCLFWGQKDKENVFKNCSVVVLKLQEYTENILHLYDYSFYQCNAYTGL